MTVQIAMRADITGQVVGDSTKHFERLLIVAQFDGILPFIMFDGTYYDSISVVGIIYAGHFIATECTIDMQGTIVSYPSIIIKWYENLTSVL